MSIGGGAGALLIGLVSLSTVCGGTLPPPAPPRAGQPADTDVPRAVPAPPRAGVQRGARVRGRLVSQDGRQLLSGAVILSPIDEPPVQVPSEDVTISPDGTFEFRNVPPGRYEVRARALTQPDGVGLFATYRVTVDGTDVEEEVVLTLVPGATASGGIIVEKRQSAEPPQLNGLLVRAPLADGSSFGDAVTGRSNDEGQFAIRGLMAGSHVVRIQGLQDPWVLKSVVLRGRDVTDAGFDAESGQEIRDLRVTITDVATQVTGTVRDAGGNGTADATVLVVPLSPQFWTRSSRRLVVLHTDASGRYRVRGLPAGEYRLVASAALDEADAFRRDLLRDVAAAGVPLSLEPLQSRVLDLQLTRIGLISGPEPRFE
jgi:hypothetical protein